ncbi:MAG: hypothetical protein ABIY63_13270 [Fibrobacteria bacterium]
MSNKEAPERIFLHQESPGYSLWCQEQINIKSIQYIRKDLADKSEAELRERVKELENYKFMYEGLCK